MMADQASVGVAERLEQTLAVAQRRGGVVRLADQEERVGERVVEAAAIDFRGHPVVVPARE